MKIPGWGYMLVGVVISVTSGVIYKTVPKNGEPNMAMALFFFIGMIFIIIGVIKFFFIKMDDTQELQYSKVQHEMNKKPVQENFRNKQSKIPENTHTNRVEAQMNRIYSQQTTQPNHNQHSSTYAKTHPYNHTTNNPQTHNQHQTTHNATHSMVIIPCKKCGNKNPHTSNYCHQCGQGLK